MSEVDQGEGQVVPAHPMGLPPLKPNQERTVDIDPRKNTLGTSTQSVDDGIEEPPATATLLLLIALVGLDIGHNTAIETDFARTAAVKGRIAIEIRTAHIKSMGLDLGEHLLEILVKVVAVMMVARDGLGTREHAAALIAQGHDIGCLGLLAGLIGDGLAAFFGQRVTAIEVQYR